MTRIWHYAPDELTEEQRQLYDEFVGGPRGQAGQAFSITDEKGRLVGPFNAMLLSPPIGVALQGLGAAIRFRSGLTPRARELAILLVAVHSRSRFEREAHEAIARQVGLEQEVLVAVAAGQVPELSDPYEAAVVSTVGQLLAGDLDDEAYLEARRQLTEQALFELATLVGYYGLLALQMRVFRVDTVPDYKCRQ